MVYPGTVLENDVWRSNVIDPVIESHGEECLLLRERDIEALNTED